MFSSSCRAVAASLLTITVMAVVNSPLSQAADEERKKTLSPEMILKDKFEGEATVELQVREVGTVNIDSLFRPGMSHAQVIWATIPEANINEGVAVTISREVATRLLNLGIADPAEHFRGKILRVSGTVQRFNLSSHPSMIVYKIQVTNLDQLESIRSP